MAGGYFSENIKREELPVFLSITITLILHHPQLQLTALQLLTSHSCNPSHTISISYTSTFKDLFHSQNAFRSHCSHCPSSPCREVSTPPSSTSLFVQRKGPSFLLIKEDNLVPWLATIVSVRTLAVNTMALVNTAVAWMRGMAMAHPFIPTSTIRYTRIDPRTLFCRY